MKGQQYYLNRDVTKEECPWLDADIKEGTTVFKYIGPTYGCITPLGTACTFTDEGPFFELPIDALNSFMQQ